MLIKYLRELKKQRGDTIVEVLLSVTILGLVLAVSFASAGRSLNAGTDAASRNQAINYAQQQIELLRSAANSGKISSYPTDGTNFCIDPSDGSKKSVGSDGLCHLSGQMPFGVAIKYNSSNQTYNVVSQWQGITSADNVSLYYQVPANPITSSPNVGISISASPSVIAYGGSTTINWTTTTAMSCTASGGWSGSQPTLGSKTFNNLTTTTTYTLTCKSTDGSSSVSRSAKVYVSQLPAPTVNFTASPSSISYNAASTLNWAAVNAVSCTGSGGWSGSQPLSGNQSTGNLTTTTSYTLDCVGRDGVSHTTQTVTVTVAPPPNPTVSLSASPSSISYDTSTTLSWSSSNATSCAASGGWSGAKSVPSGSQGTGNLTSSTTYTITCSGINGTTPASSSVTVSVGAPPPPPRPSSCNSSSVSVSGTHRNGDNSLTLVAAAGGCQYYSNNYVGWNGGGSWTTPPGQPYGYTFCQNGGVDPWGFYAQSCTWI